MSNVLITGASRGLGREIARVMWKSGASVILVARSEPALAELQSELMQSVRDDQRASICVADLEDPDAPSKIVANSPPVDVLVNNAAILGPVGRVWENDWSGWQETVHFNLLAPVALCRAIIPQMIERGSGRIINISGGGATGPRPNFSAYATAKAGLVRFTETLAEELKETHIYVNCIAPGVMNTQMNQAIAETGLEKSVTRGSPERAADLCLFLASSTITGKLISAVWDPWRNLADHVAELNGSDIYTLRRIVPQDRGKNWTL